jgi:hypothetical protein
VNASNKIRLGNSFVTVVEGPLYSVVSDKNKKENFKAIDAEGVLQKVRDLSVTSWNYIGHDPAVRHYGPVAQDFFAAFGNDGVGTIGVEDSVSALTTAGKLRPGMRGVSLWLGIDNVRLNQPVQGIVFLREAVRQDPTDKLAQS